MDIYSKESRERASKIRYSVYGSDKYGWIVDASLPGSDINAACKYAKNLSCATTAKVRLFALGCEAIVDNAHLLRVPR